MLRIALTTLVLVITFVGCSTEPKTPATKAEPAAAPFAGAPKPLDESRRFPRANLKSAVVVDEHMMGKPFLPGGNLATYSRGGKQYKLFLVKLRDGGQAGIAVLDYKKDLKDARFVASYGGYFGDENGTPVFVFAKNEWLLGVVGLAMEEAEPVAREFAGRL